MNLNRHELIIITGSCVLIQQWGAVCAHRFSSKWNYLMWTTPIDSCLLQPLENVTRHKFLPALTGKKGAFSDTGRALLALLVRLGV